MQLKANQTAKTSELIQNLIKIDPAFLSHVLTPEASRVLIYI